MFRLNSQASQSKVAMRKIVLWINSDEAEETNFTRNYLNFKVFGSRNYEIIQDPKISDVGKHAESLELQGVGHSRLREGLRKYAKREDEDITDLLQWIQTFTNLERLRIYKCNFPENFSIQVSKKLKILISTEDGIKVMTTFWFMQVFIYFFLKYSILEICWNLKCVILRSLI